MVYSAIGMCSQPFCVHKEPERVPRVSLEWEMLIHTCWVRVVGEEKLGVTDVYLFDSVVETMTF